MADNISSPFLGIESQKRQEINALMAEWKSQIASSKGKTNTWGEDINPEDYFVSDGFFPGYYKQKTKVLFIGRETRYTEGDYIESTMKNYEENNDHNQSAFTRHLLYIVQGIKHNGEYAFEQLEEANYYAKEMVDTKDYGFAFMNISKYTNDTDEGDKADWPRINQFLLDSDLENTKFFCKELEILGPDIIITGNLWNVGIKQEYLDLCFGKIDWKNKNFIREVDKVNEGTISINGKSVKLLDAYHLSARKSDKDDYYDPIMGIIFGKK